MNTIDILLGRSIAQQRQLLCMSQDDLAQRLHISTHTIDAFEQGMRRATAKQLFEIADALNVQIGVLFSQDDSFERKECDPSLPPEAQAIAGHYGSLSKSHRSAIFAFIVASNRNDQ
ncbi:MAG: helix-turn-helix transcriptional regulator [Rhodobacterales bacterium]|nr:helix-turn-helix transcriptional regulator [Rhodobacterales bacterium]